MFSTNPAMEAEEIMKSVDIDHNGKIDYNGSLFLKKKKLINKTPLYLKNSHWLLLIANKFLLIKGWKQLLKCLMRMQMVFFFIFENYSAPPPPPPPILKGYISLAEMRNVFSGSSIKDNEFW